MCQVSKITKIYLYYYYYLIVKLRELNFLLNFIIITINLSFTPVSCDSIAHFSLDKSSFLYTIDKKLFFYDYNA